MKKALIITSALGLALAVSEARAQTPAQNNDDTWDGPGFYAEDLVTSLKDGNRYLWKLGGPFTSVEACQTYLANLHEAPVANSTESKQCVYRGSTVTYEGCFLTTPCVAHAGLADDCEELTVLRGFRDDYLLRFDEGRRLVDEYYNIAPGIVRAIDASANRDRALDWVLRQVRSTARAVGDNESELALRRYAAMVARLQQRYAVDCSCPDQGRMPAA